MLIEKFKPTRNLVLVKNEYVAKGLILMNPSKEVNLKIKDKVVVAVGPDVTSVKVGDIIAVSERAFNVDIINFVDNDLSIHKVGERVRDAVAVFNSSLGQMSKQMQMQQTISSPASKDYDVVGYVVLPESEIIGTCNSVSEEPVESKSSIIIPV